MLTRCKNRIYNRGSNAAARFRLIAELLHAVPYRRRRRVRNVTTQSSFIKPSKPTRIIVSLIVLCRDIPSRTWRRLNYLLTVQRISLATECYPVGLSLLIFSNVLSVSYSYFYTHTEFLSVICTYVNFT